MKTVQPVADIGVSDERHILDGMTDPVDTSAGSFANSQRPKRARATIAELALIVRPPGNPSAVQAFTADEASDAQQYADVMGAQVEPLPGT